ncbi:GAF domain protein [Rubrobacter radiotolerans]|uniref:GAF domain protein n=1 Tax=Rubrobacter radiotolerans TaxID=42256 RepID=A0A023X4L1_RUBRA|nr:GAF domain-containing protein [Rubrobacter radiotolerans]AHY46989.1 GAF domain protein [Rubrobacter radiotolerans]MDX5894395.1 GAF domain-containing protein [Rubrobacter radiotolerans]SMC05905.1 GAF domain-containing protein [Rubrobacter radiotolerans DSM 5868]
MKNDGLGSANRIRGALEAVLASATESLEMDAAFVARIDGDRLVFRAFRGRGESFGLAEGMSIDLDESYCKLLLDGRIEDVVRNTCESEVVANLDATREAGINSYVGVPLEMSDGRTYGTLCCLSHSPSPWLAKKDLELMRKLASETIRLLEEEEAHREEPGRPL